MTMKTLLTVRELAEDPEFREVFSSIQVVYRAVRSHGLPYMNPTGRMLFDREEVREWIAQSRRGGSAPRKFIGKVVFASS